MVMPLTKIAPGILLAAAAAAVNIVNAQDSEPTIVGCRDLECPPAGDGENDNCTVADRSFIAVGTARLASDNKALEGLAWTQGFHAASTEHLERDFGSSFYLSTPPDLDLAKSGTGACALFFHGLHRTLEFDESGPHLMDTEGTCADAMGAKCVEALTFWASELEVDRNASAQENCDALREHLLGVYPQACEEIRKPMMSLWIDQPVTAVALTGNEAPEPITEKQNASSTCWPTRAKQNDLTFVADYKYNASRPAALSMAWHGITPVLTLFYPGGKDSLVDEVDASLTCLKAIGPARALSYPPLDGESETDNDSDESTDGPSNVAAGLSASSFYSSVFGTVLATVISLMG